MTSIDKQIEDYPKCKDRISDQLEGREEYLREVCEAIDSGHDYDGYSDPTELLWEFAIGIETYTVVKIQLSYGGPSDWLEVFIDKESGYPEIMKIKYHFADWYDHAECMVERNSPIYSYVETILDGIV